MRGLLLVGVMSAAVFCGCVKNDGPVPVTGTVKYPDGSIPAGEVCDVRFEREGGKMARGVIGADGTFKLTTMEPDDGAFPGQYKVCLEVFKTYMGRESVVAPEFEKMSTTPLNADVKRGDKNHFDFVVKPRP